MINRLSVLTLAFILCACSEKDAPRVDHAISAPVQVAETSLATYHAGKELYMTHCFFCHGKDADGNGALAVSMEGAKPRDFTQPAMATAHPDSLKRAILEGGEAVGLSASMPAWSSTISDLEADLLVDFIQIVSKNGGVLPETEPPLQLTDIPQESQTTY